MCVGGGGHCDLRQSQPKCNGQLVSAAQFNCQLKSVRLRCIVNGETRANIPLETR